MTAYEINATKGVCTDKMPYFFQTFSGPCQKEKKKKKKKKKRKKKRERENEREKTKPKINV